MTTTITGAELRGYHAGNQSGYRSAADYIIPGDDIRAIDITSRATDLKDNGKLTIDNPRGQWSGQVRHGDRLEFLLGDAKSGEGYGEGGYGVGPYGTSRSLRWTGLVRPYEISGSGAELYDLNLTAEDFPAAIMGFRSVYAVFEDRQIVGSNGLVNEVLQEHCPELDTSRLPGLSQTTSMFLHGKSVLDVVAEAARRCDCVLKTQNRYVEFVQASSVVPEFTVTTNDVGPFSSKSNDDNVVNDLRVEGGSGRDVEEQAKQTTVDGYQTVTQSNRITHQIQTRKSEIDRVEIWTRTTGSEEDVVVRMQKDDGGAPIAPGSNKSDIAKKTLSHEFLADDGWTTFIFPEHTLPEPSPWLLIESEGSSGQDIGINSSTSEPGVIPFYPYDVIVETSSPDSIEAYRRREDKLSDDSLDSFSAARDAGDSHLSHNDEPTKIVSVEALSERMHGLRPGDVVALNRPEVEAVGDFVVTEVADNYQGDKLHTTLTLQDIASL